MGWRTRWDHLCCTAGWETNNPRVTRISLDEYVSSTLMVASPRPVTPTMNLGFIKPFGMWMRIKRKLAFKVASPTEENTARSCFEGAFSTTAEPFFSMYRRTVTCWKHARYRKMSNMSGSTLRYLCFLHTWLNLRGKSLKRKRLQVCKNQNIFM